MEATYTVEDDYDTAIAPPTTEVVKKMRKKRRFKNETLAIKHITKMQKSTDLLVPKVAFKRLVHELTFDISSNIRYSKNALLAIQEASEAYVTSKLKRANNCCIRSKRKTILTRDMKYDDDIV